MNPTPRHEPTAYEPTAYERDTSGHVTYGQVTGVDTHAHVLRTDLPLTPDRHSAPARDATVEEYLSLLDSAGLSHGVLTAPSFYGTDNTLLLQALAAAPDRLRGTVSLPAEADPAELHRLRERGVVGVRFNWSRWSRGDRLPDPNAPEYQRLFAAARDADLHVEVLIEDAYLPGFAAAVARTGAELVIDHFGLAEDAGPGTDAMVRFLEEQRAWVKLSAPYRPPARDLRALTERLLRTAPDRLLWGSDWPWVQHEHDVTGYGACLTALTALTALVPDPAHREAVLTANPGRLLGLR
ncbi:amidohydrolase family protein [Streptomyces sp. NPDC050617]|uniref:amidohydrolase family protein n=1 Tax=Streptomyces sp. NPDC050617 TaxID=3154628 RepID=UPI003424FCD2